MSSKYFSLDPQLIYLNHAAVAPWPVNTVAAVSRFAQENGLQGALNYPDWVQVESALRARLAELIHAPSSAEIGLLKSTSEGLSVIAHGLDWKAGDNIVSIAQEFPSNRIVWESLKPRGVEVRLLDLATTAHPETALTELCDENTRLLSTSSVQYATGRRMDLEQLGAFCQAHEIFFIVDAIQSLGAFPIDITTNHADAVVADGHKWMLGPEGLALFYCGESLKARLELHQFGWHMVEHAGDFDRPLWTPAPSARRFECGSPNMLGVHALHASLGLLQEIGIERVAGLIQGLCDRIIEQTDQRGFELLTPRDPGKRAGIVTFRIPDRDNARIQGALMKQGVVCASRGGGIRFSPHFHITIAQIDQAFERLDRLLTEEY